MKGLGCSAATYNPLLPQREKRKTAQPSDYDKSELLGFGGGCALNIFGRVKCNDIENRSKWSLEKLGVAPCAVAERVAQNSGEIDSVPASAESRAVSSLVTPASSKTSGQFGVENFRSDVSVLITFQTFLVSFVRGGGRGKEKGNVL